jgi:glycosyltransferase involved in cell wall biosynthesis
MSNKIKILIGCLSFKNFTGSEMYIYELSKYLTQLDCDVTITSPNLGDPLVSLAQKNGIKIHNFDTQLLTQIFDIIHTQHKPITEALVKAFPNIKKITTIHSEVISLENPVMDNSILKYIAIRPEIKDHLINNFNIPKDKIEVIYNPIDSNRFNPTNTTDNGYVLFVGTIDYLRQKSIEDLVEYAKGIGKELWLVGKSSSNYLGKVLENTHVKHYNDTYNVEDFVKNCSETAGILLGRTTIEGWMCGKPGWIYNVNSLGEIISKDRFEVPSDISKFDGMEVAKKIKEEYIKIL